MENDIRAKGTSRVEGSSGVINTQQLSDLIRSGLVYVAE
jgi:hypothetical protein